MSGNYTNAARLKNDSKLRGRNRSQLQTKSWLQILLCCWFGDISGYSNTVAVGDNLHICQKCE